MVGQERLFTNLEPIILKSIDSLSPRDLSHAMYSYAVRGAGNPELHSAFEKRLMEVAGELDYPGLHNAFYYMMFRENANEKIWRQLVDNTIN
jgi:hypothetical protein